jgi:cytochrome c-type biogenesis protein CcmH
LAACGLAYWLARPLSPAQWQRPFFAVLGGVPLLALGLYLYLGNPNMPDAPLAPRLSGALDKLPPAAILARLENELRQRPDDAQGWRLLARLRVTLQQNTQAADAWQRLLDLVPGDIEATTGLAVALIEREDGVINQAVVDLLDAALAQDADNIQAQFWRAEAWAQQGRDDRARILWHSLRAKLPDNVPLAQMLDRRLSN